MNYRCIADSCGGGCETTQLYHRFAHSFIGACASSHRLATRGRDTRGRDTRGHPPSPPGTPSAQPDLPYHVMQVAEGRLAEKALGERRLPNHSSQQLLRTPDHGALHGRSTAQHRTRPSKKNSRYAPRHTGALGPSLSLLLNLLRP